MGNKKQDTFTPKRNDIEINTQETSSLNENNDLETTNFATDEMLESIQFEDSTV